MAVVADVDVGAGRAVHQVRRPARAEPVPVAVSVSGKERRMIERGKDRRRGVSSYFTSPVNDRRRPRYERRGTVPQVAAPTRGEQVYGERRVLPDAGLE